MSPRPFVQGDRVILIEDGMSGTVYRVLSGADVDWCSPIYEIVWDHAPGMTAYGSRHYGPALALIDRPTLDNETRG